jgi:hypothetical protein
MLLLRYRLNWKKMNVVIAVFITFMASIIIFVLSSYFLFSRFGALAVTNISEVSQKTGTITTQKTQKVGPQNTNQVSRLGRGRERDTKFEKTTQDTGAVCPVPAPRRVRCRAGLVTPRFRF